MQLQALTLFALAAYVMPGCVSVSTKTPSSPSTEGPASISGTWKTEAPAPYVIEHSVHKPQGTAVPHDHIELLVERPDGLITGTAHWGSHGPDGHALRARSRVASQARASDRLGSGPRAVRSTPSSFVRQQG